MLKRISLLEYQHMAPKWNAIHAWNNFSETKTVTNDAFTLWVFNLGIETTFVRATEVCYDLFGQIEEDSEAKHHFDVN